MKKVCILVVMCLLAGMALSSCGSSKACPAYSSVTNTAFVQPSSAIQQPVN